MTKKIWLIINSDPLRSMKFVKWDHSLVELVPYFVFVLHVLGFLPLQCLQVYYYYWLVLFAQ